MFANYFKTILLLGILSSLFVLAGTALAGSNGLIIALSIALIMNGIAYFFSERIVLGIYKAKKLDAHEYPYVYQIVEELRVTMRLPMPKLWIIHTDMPNAFATGRSPAHASIAVTTGILEILDADELRGVLAHELAHIKNRDILIGTIAATLAAAIAHIGSMARYAAIWGSSSDNKKKGNPLAMLIVAIFVPLAATLMQLAISRSREYGADETGAYSCHDPLALASALEKLHQHIPRAHLNPEKAGHASTASLFIMHPFSTQTMLSLFATHPPVHKRIERLRKIHQKIF